MKNAADYIILPRNKFMMNKTDAIVAAVIGEATGLYFFNFLGNANNAETGAKVLTEPFASMLWTILIAFPILAPLCLWIASLIGKRFLAIYQLAKFLLVGVLAFIFDLGTLGIFMKVGGVADGPMYLIFKAGSFLISTILKYIPDKYWAFKKKESAGAKKEFMQFLTVTLIGLTVNLAAAGFTVNIVGPQFNLDKDTWGSIGGMVGVIVAFAWNFVGYKFFVFKK
jgi:putative flippase GtrA